MKRRNFIISAITATLVVLVFFLCNRFFSKDDNTVIKAGFIYVSDGANAYTKNFMDAQEDLEELYGDRLVCLAKYNIPDDQPIDKYIQELIDSGCDIIFATSYGYNADMKKFAERYPDIQFCQATGSNANEEPVISNYHTYMGHIYEGRYLSGVVAGMKLNEMIEQGVITEDEALLGYVAAYPYSEVISGYTAFFLGVRSQCPTATMKVRYTYSWGNYSLEKEYAEILIDEGCVIISQHSDTKGPAVACEQASGNHKVYVVSYNKSMMDVAPTTALTGSRINWFAYEKQAIGALLEGKSIEKNFGAGITINGTDVGAGFKAGWIEMLDMNPITVAKGTKEIIEKYKKELDEGKIKVFYGDYIGVNPFDPNDTIDLNTEYKENISNSAPMFNYVLKDVIEIEED